MISTFPMNCRLKRYASASIQCEDPFSLAAPYDEELDNDIDHLVHDQDIHAKVISEVIRIELKIVMKKKLIAVATRKANMYFSRFKQRPVGLNA